MGLRGGRRQAGRPATGQPGDLLKRGLLDISPLRTAPRFRRLWLGQTLSGFGNQLTLIAVMFQVWQSTHSTVWTGAVGMAEALPLILLGLFAGTVVDRVDRRRLYLVTTAGQAVFSVLLAVQAFVGHLPVAVVLALVAGQGCFMALGGPAARTFLPHLLPQQQLGAGLALVRIGFQGPMLVGPAVGGLLIAGVGLGGCYLIDAVTFLGAIHGALGLPAMPRGEAVARPGLRGVGDGLAFLVRTPAVRGALLTDLAATVLSMPISLFPLVNAERFGDDPRTLGLFMMAIAVGGVTASVFSGTFTRRPRPGLVMLTGSAAWGVALVLFGVAPDPWLGLLFLVAAGAADTLAVVSRSTIVQSHTPDALLGRVSAAEQVVGQAGPQLGNLRGGLVAGGTSGVVSLVSGGLLCVLAVGLVAWRTPELRRARVGGGVWAPAPAGPEGPDRTEPAVAGQEL